MAKTCECQFERQASKQGIGLASEARESLSTFFSFSFSLRNSVGDRMSVPARRIPPAALKVPLVGVVPSSVHKMVNIRQTAFK